MIERHAVVAAGGLQKVMKHCRHTGEEREFPGFQEPQRFRGRKPLHDMSARAGGQNAQHRQIQRVGMEQRER